MLSAPTTTLSAFVILQAHKNLILGITEVNRKDQILRAQSKALPRTERRREADSQLLGYLQRDVASHDQARAYHRLPVQLRERHVALPGLRLLPLADGSPCTLEATRREVLGDTPLRVSVPEIPNSEDEIAEGADAAPTVVHPQALPHQSCVESCGGPDQKRKREVRFDKLLVTLARCTQRNDRATEVQRRARGTITGDVSTERWPKAPCA